MDIYPNKVEGYTWGIRIIFWWTIFAVIFMAFAWCYALRKFKVNLKSDEKQLVPDDMNQSMGDLVKFIF